MSTKRSKLLSVKEVAEWFGVNPMTIYRKVKRGEMPAIKFGKSWLFPEDTLQEWLRSQTKGGGKNLETALKNLAPHFASLPEIQLVYFFGSALTGNTTPLSDIDIAYLDDGSTLPFDLEAKLEGLITEQLPSNLNIDLVRLNDAPVAMQHKIISTGRSIYKASDAALATFEEDVINRYLDYSYTLNQFYQNAYKNLKEVA